MTAHPVFCVSDLHMGDTGRDNFAHMSGGHREREFHSFLDYVESCNGGLYIVGDLFELWQGNVSKVLTCRIGLLDRLARMRATYILGNHDIDLRHFSPCPSGIGLSHPLLARALQQLHIIVGGKRILLLHGHEQDPYCWDERPGIGRISAIYAGLKEDRNGGPLRNKYQTIEAHTLSRFSRMTRFARKCLGIKCQTTATRTAMLSLFEGGKADAIIFGHTHEPGQFVLGGSRKLPIYNLGSWCEQIASYVRIDPDGAICVMDWLGNRASLNYDKLPVTRA